MTLDIVIPALNEENNLKNLLPFLKKQQSADNFNIIVIDAFDSTDNSKSICDNNEVFYKKTNQSQRSIQMNEGAAMLSGEYIMFLHADVTPPKNFYNLIISAIDKGNKAGCFAYKFDNENPLLKINSYFTKYNGFYTGGGDQIHFISRSMFEKLGGYCTKHTIMEDFDFYQRIKKSKITTKIIATPAIVSARKYKNNSWFKVNLINLIALVNYKVNRDPFWVKSFYDRWLSD